MTTFDTVLVANRGEIAVRVLRGAKRLGYRTVAVYSDADREALHVREADVAVRIGPAPAAQSYLDIAAILDAARSSGAQAIHPGYGFLSERAAFARAVHDAGLIFIGPGAEAIEAMGSKSESKRRMLASGVPCVPGYQSTADDAQGQADERLHAEALRIGLPVMVKAAAGGGGRGLRRVDDASTLLEQIRSARSEALSAFGDGELLIEKAVIDARHVEIQVFGDTHGNVVHLGERDCSLQRRNQKVIEEAPSPAVDADLRARMGAAAVAAARAVHYVGAGTVEFLLALDGAFYFLEMNTRLQVEHPVTEAVYGVDLVEWQLRVARGEALPLTQAQIDDRRRGWAMEVRLCAEDPAQGFLPQTGTVLAWRVPDDAGLRVDGALVEGAAISPHYDSLQAKLIAWGQDREQARLRLLDGLRRTTLLGVVSNQAFLCTLLADPDFVAGDCDTGFIAARYPPAALAAQPPDARDAALATVAFYLEDAQRLMSAHGLAQEFIGWHSSHESPASYRLAWGVGEQTQVYEVELQAHAGRVFHLRCAQQHWVVEVLDAARSADVCEFACRVEGVDLRLRAARQGDTLWLAEGAGRSWAFVDHTLAPAAVSAPGSDGRLQAQSDGKLAAVQVTVGEVVQAGQTLAVLEAMKMEFQLSLPVNGTVRAVHVAAGQQVRNRQLLIEVEPVSG